MIPHIFVKLTKMMSHEGQRARDARIQDKADRAVPHWLNPLC